MKVYHGSTIIVKKPLVNVGRRNLDFGKGFYVTDLKEQAVSWAKRPINKNQPQILNVYELNLDQVVADGFKYKIFRAYDNEWLDFVVANRMGKELWKEFDIIQGGIANDRVFNTIELFMSGLIPEEETLKRLSFENPNNQICILRQSIADLYLDFVEYYEINI